MASYYGYAERSAEDQINWSAIGKGMTDMLKEEQDRPLREPIEGCLSTHLTLLVTHRIIICYSYDYLSQGS